MTPSSIDIHFENINGGRFGKPFISAPSYCAMLSAKLRLA